MSILTVDGGVLSLNITHIVLKELTRLIRMICPISDFMYNLCKEDGSISDLLN